MNIFHFATHDVAGGAAKAAYQLHSALRNAGHVSRMIVRSKCSDDEDVRRIASISTWRRRFRQVKRHIPLLRENLPTATYMYNLDIEPPIDTRLFYNHQPGHVDIICLHWITGLLTVRAIKKIYDHYQCPLIWTLMDMEPITGGCHYSLGCDGFTKRCGNCSQLNTNRSKDRSHTVWRRKHRYLCDLPIVFVAPTSWIAERVRQSSLFRDHRVEIIPLPIDKTTFRPVDQRAARDLLRVPQDKKVIFFGASSIEDPRKGMAYLAEALQQLPSMMEAKNRTLSKEKVFLLAAGRKVNNLLESMPFPNRYLGYLKDDITLALAYQAADIFVCPSTEDAGPMMIPESMLCGTPVVAFNTGGAPDLIETMKSGYLAGYKDAADLANGLYTLLTADNLPAVREAAYEAAVKEHSPTTVASRHLELYSSLLDNGQALRNGEESLFGGY